MHLHHKVTNFATEKKIDGQDSRAAHVVLYARNGSFERVSHVGVFECARTSNNSRYVVGVTSIDGRIVVKSIGAVLLSNQFY